MLNLRNLKDAVKRVVEGDSSPKTEQVTEVEVEFPNFYSFQYIPFIDFAVTLVNRQQKGFLAGFDAERQESPVFDYYLTENGIYFSDPLEGVTQKEWTDWFLSLLSKDYLDLSNLHDSETLPVQGSFPSDYPFGKQSDLVFAYLNSFFNESKRRILLLDVLRIEMMASSINDHPAEIRIGEFYEILRMAGIDAAYFVHHPQNAFKVIQDSRNKDLNFLIIGFDFGNIKAKKLWIFLERIVLETFYNSKAFQLLSEQEKENFSFDTPIKQLFETDAEVLKPKQR
jgi:hypothetical protein